MLHSWPWNTNRVRVQTITASLHQVGAAHRKAPFISATPDIKHSLATPLGSDTDYSHCSHLLLYPFTCQTTLKVSQKQNSTASRKHCIIKAGTPCAPNQGRGNTRLENTAFFIDFLKIQSRYLLLTLPKVCPELPSQNKQFQVEKRNVKLF